MEKCKYSLREVKFPDGQRQNFSAGLFKDGKRVAGVSSCGQVVNCSFEWDGEKEKQSFDEFISSQPEREFKDYQTPFKITENIDSFIANLLSEYEFDLWMGKLMEKATVFRCKDDKAGEYHVVDEIYSQDVKGRILNEFGDKLEEVFNEREVNGN